MRYPHSESLKNSRDFRKVYETGKSSANRLLVMYVRENGTKRNRVGISVSKKIGNSVVRHRITRLIRESYRLNEDMFSNGLDIVVVARKGSKDGSLNEITDALLHLGKLRGIIKKNEISDDQDDPALSKIPVTP